MKKQDKPEISELSLVPVNADIGKKAVSVGYDGGFSLLEPAEAEMSPGDIPFREGAKRHSLQDFTFG